jgi:hypothetical protein
MFTHGEITGHGYKYFSSSKCRYKGQFWRGEMHGKGMMEFPDGSVYEGTFVHNRKNGLLPSCNNSLPKPTKYLKKNTLHKSTGN